VEVEVTDECQSCGPSDLDLSPAAFSQLAPESEGRYILSFKEADGFRIPITWEFIS
jgi:hypothetical protein